MVSYFLSDIITLFSYTTSQTLSITVTFLQIFSLLLHKAFTFSYYSIDLIGIFNAFLYVILLLFL